MSKLLTLLSEDSTTPVPPPEGPSFRFDEARNSMYVGMGF